MKTKNNKKTKAIKGVIHWYDKESKHGCIVSLDSVWYRIHEFTKLIGNKNYIPKEGDHILFKLADDSVKPIVKIIKKTKKNHRIKKQKSKKPKVARRSIRIMDQFSGRLVTLSGYSVINYHWIEVRHDDNKMEAIQGLFNDPQGPIAMWNGTWDKYCGHGDDDAFEEK